MPEIRLNQIQAQRLGAMIHQLDIKAGVFALEAVALEIEAGTLTAYATDRFTMSRYQTETDAPDMERVLIPHDAVKFLADYAKKSPAALRIDGDALSIEIENGPTIRGATQKSQFPEVARFFTEAEARKDQQGNGYNISARFLERLVKMAKAYGKNARYATSASLDTAGKPSPVLFEIGNMDRHAGDRFSMIVQPNRIEA